MISTVTHKHELTFSSLPPSPIRLLRTIPHLLPHPTSRQVCDKYTANDGRSVWFLADDTSVECSNAAGLPYASAERLAIAMVVVVVLGIPTFQFLVVWKWAHPFQRLHIPTEDGEWVPNPAAKRLMGALFSTYKPWAYMGALANTVSKLLLTAVVGLAFNKSQGNGMLLSAFFCFGWSFGLAIHRPFVYHRVRFSHNHPSQSSVLCALL